MDNLNKVIICLGILALNLNMAYAESTISSTYRDPTEPVTSSPGSESEIKPKQNSNAAITAIFSGKDHKAVMIGNHTFTINDKVFGATIIAIDSNGITLKYEDGSTARVTLPYTPVKLPTTDHGKKKREKLD